MGLEPPRAVSSPRGALERQRRCGAVALRGRRVVFSSPVSFCRRLSPASPAPCERERWALPCGRGGSGGSGRMMEGMGGDDGTGCPTPGGLSPLAGLSAQSMLWEDVKQRAGGEGLRGVPLLQHGLGPQPRRPAPPKPVSCSPHIPLGTLLGAEGLRRMDVGTALRRGGFPRAANRGRNIRKGPGCGWAPCCARSSARCAAASQHGPLAPVPHATP